MLIYLRPIYIRINAVYGKRRQQQQQQQQPHESYLSILKRVCFDTYIPSLDAATRNQQEQDQHYQYMCNRVNRLKGKMVMITGGGEDERVSSSEISSNVEKNGSRNSSNKKKKKKSLTPRSSSSWLSSYSSSSSPSFRLQPGGSCAHCSKLNDIPECDSFDDSFDESGTEQAPTVSSPNHQARHSVDGSDANDYIDGHPCEGHSPSRLDDTCPITKRTLQIPASSLSSSSSFMMAELYDEFHVVRDEFQKKVLRGGEGEGLGPFSSSLSNSPSIVIPNLEEEFEELHREFQNILQSTTTRTSNAVDVNEDCATRDRGQTEDDHQQGSSTS